jgi:hypothetical protein
MAVALQTDDSYRKREMLKSKAYCAIGIATLMAFHSIPATAAAFSSYEECILDKMKGVTSDVAAKAIIGACRKVTAPLAETLCTPRPVNNDELGLKGTIKFGGYYPNQYSARLHNPSKTLTVKRLVIEVEFSLKDGTKETRAYNETVSIAPLSTGTFETFTEFNDREAKVENSSIIEVYACEE